MTERNETFLHRWFEEVWNQGREDAIDEMMSEDCVAHGLTDAEGKTIGGVESFKPFFKNFRSAFPDLHVKVLETVSEGDKHVALCAVTATHEGSGINLVPRQQPVEFKGLCLVKIKDGKIAEAWNHFDFMGMYAQLGAVQLMFDE